MGNIAAFFDIDGTIYRDALSIALFKKLSKNGIIPHTKWHNDIKPLYDKWVNRTGNYDDYINTMSIVYQECIVGLNSKVLNFWANQVIEEKGERLYKYTKERLNWHKEQGHKVVIISGTPYELAKNLSAKLKVDDFVATVYITDENNNYTPEKIPMWRNVDKIGAINKFKEKYDLDLDKCYAYGDTNGDITMFEAVGYPTMINPTMELIEGVMNNETILNKINTIIERKDVIYNIDIKNVNIVNRK